MAVISDWDLLLKYVQPGQDLQLGNLDYKAPLTVSPSPELNGGQFNSAMLAPKEQSGWAKFGEVLKKIAPLAIAAYAVSTPQNGVMYGSAAQAWQQAQELERQAEAQKQAQELARQNAQLNQQKFELKQQQLADEKAQQQESQKVTQQKAQENYNVAMTALDALPDNDPRKPALKTAINYATVTGNYDDVQKLLNGLVPETPKPLTPLEQAQIRKINAEITNMGKDETATTKDPLLMSYKDLNNMISDPYKGDSIKQKLAQQYSKAIRDNINDPKLAQQYIDRYNYLTGKGYTYGQWKIQSQKQYSPETNKPVVAQKTTSSKTWVYDSTTGKLVKKK